MDRQDFTVSIIVPTKDRAWLHAGLLWVFRHQHCTDIELLVADSGAQGPSECFKACDDPRVHYFWFDRDIPVGAKRNFLAEKARGEVIVHFDDDDYYGPDYVTRMLSYLNDSDFVTLSGWYNRDVRTGDLFYWDTTCETDYVFTPGLTTTVSTQPLLTRSATRANTLGYGFSYAYRRHLWERNPFPEINFQEDFRFVNGLGTRAAVRSVRDTDCTVVHSLWEHTLSSCTPQYRLPEFLLAQLAPGAADYYQRFHTSPLAEEFIYMDCLDSDGGDLHHVGKLSPNALLSSCLKADGVAVNSNGWIKSSIRPRTQWTQLPANSGGMWVRKGIAAQMGLDG